MQEYVVTLRSRDELDDFYSDMETPGGSATVPDREVTCSLRRPISRNTNYELEEDEAQTLKEDERVLDVFPKAILDLVEHKPTGWTNPNTFDSDKSNFIGSDMVNWGLLRCTNQDQIVNWGSDGTNTINREIECTASGVGVDVIIVDGFLDRDHPQMAVNADGTGGTRFVAEDWGQLRPFVDGGAAFNYQYTTGQANLDNGDDNHGMHVAGTACGVTQGWARDASIRNMKFSGDPSVNPNAGQGISGTTCYDYIRAWHTAKLATAAAANEVPRPTIVNNSWGSSITITAANQGLAIQSITFQGVTTNAPNPSAQNGGFTNAQLQAFGLIRFSGDGDVEIASYQTDEETDIQEAIDDGVIMVGAAGNSSELIDSPGGANYDNTVNVSFNGGTASLFYHRGSANSAGSNGICVGAEDQLLTESKAGFSCTGPRIDVWSPGVGIMSAINGGAVTVTDPLNTSFLLTKQNGTSMASPQVTGILACWLEQNPRATQADCVEFLQKNSSRPDQLAAGGNGGFTDDSDLQGADRRILCFDFLRPSAVSPAAGDVVAYPHPRYGSRPDDGMLLPRNNRFVTPFTGGGGGGGFTGTITLTSPAFNDGDALANAFWFDQGGCPGSNDSPELNWVVSGDTAPAGSTWRLNCTDLDGGPWVHWAVTNIPNSTVTIAQNGTWPAGTTVGQNDWDLVGGTSRANGWGGPCPPGGTGLHRYQFQIELMDTDGTTVLGTSNTLTSNITA